MNIIKIWCLALIVQFAASLSEGQNVRAADINKGVSLSLPMLNEEIDLETIEGIHQLTKLVLLKTDSLPGDVDEKIDGRYLNGLMETLYTGLRKPFKSVSADILGIFPSFEEVQVDCEKTVVKETSREHPARIRKRQNDVLTLPVGYSNEANETLPTETDSSYPKFRTPTQVCKAVTGDCLSMEDLVSILPQSVSTFDQALVRLCPIMLFRIMNHLCDKPKDSLYANYDSESASSGRIQDEVESMGRIGDNNSINLNTLQILKNLHSSEEVNSNKRPMRLHKKLKTQTTYKTNRNLNSASLTQRGVDEQLLKIKLKLSEPSIEKVWFFSVLFSCISIVVSISGLIVLPFVNKTTRKRILTLFEGLAVGGLSGSATLHMFPQAFGLVDENYHRYFWRIFGVFFGIYLCYLCERAIKILRVVRTRRRRRSRASLINMDYRFGFTSAGSRDIVRDGWLGNKLLSQGLDFDIFNLNQDDRRRKTRHGVSSLERPYEQYPLSESVQRKLEKNKVRRSGKKRKSSRSGMSRPSEKRHSFDERMSNGASAIESPDLDNEQSIAATRQRLIKCLKSVQSQFSPVYAVYNHTNDAAIRAGEELARSSGNQQYPLGLDDLKSGHTHNPSRRNRLFENNTIFFGKTQDGLRSSTKRQSKQKEIETMLYHRNLKEQQNRGLTNTDRDYLQQRLTTVKDVAGERQDQDNAARMSVDTVAWMIVFGDAVLNVIDGLSIGAAFERNILAGISIAVAVMLEEVTHRLGTFAVLNRAGMSMKQSLLCTCVSACALFPGLVVGILLSDATEDATPYIFCAAGGIFLYMALVDVMKEMNRSLENAMRKDIRSTLQIFALQNIGILLAVVFLSFLALYEQAMDFEEYQMQYNKAS